MITSFLQQLLFLHKKASHTQFRLWLAITPSIFLALVSKQCEYSQVPFSSKGRHLCRTKSNSQTVVTSNCMVPEAPLSSASHQASEHSHLPAPSCSWVHKAYYTTTSGFVFWPRDKKNTVDWDATVGKEISGPLQKSGSAFLYSKLRQFYLLLRCSKISE